MRGRGLRLPSELADRVQALRRRPSTAEAASMLETYLYSKSSSLLTHQAQQGQGDSEENEDSESDEGGPKPDLVERMLAKRTTAQARSLNRAAVKIFRPQEYIAETALRDSELTYQELQPMGSDTLNQHLVRLGLFSSSSRLSTATLGEQMAHWKSAQFLKGTQPGQGEKAVAALQELAPQYDSKGMERLPRTYRCLKEWRCLKPGQSSPWACRSGSEWQYTFGDDGSSKWQLPYCCTCNTCASRSS